MIAPLHFRLNKSDYTPYPSEKEILLYDGLSVTVDRIFEDYKMMANDVFNGRNIILIQMTRQTTSKVTTNLDANLNKNLGETIK